MPGEWGMPVLPVRGCEMRTLGKIAQEAYREAMIAAFGDDSATAEWREMLPLEQAAWEAAANAVQSAWGCVAQEKRTANGISTLET